MAEQDDEVRRAVQAVAEADDDELYRELGLRLKAVERDPEIGKSFSPPRELLEPKGIALGDLVQVGKNYFASVSKMAYSVVCSGMQYDNDGWTPDNIDRVFAHETGHIFGCPDEYASSGCNCSAKFGWFREPNGNCQNCATPFLDCLMPGPVGPNPSLTIAALSDRFATRLLEPSVSDAWPE